MPEKAHGYCVYFFALIFMRSQMRPLCGHESTIAQSRLFYVPFLPDLRHQTSLAYAANSPTCYDSVTCFASIRQHHKGVNLTYVCAMLRLFCP
ncbi:MAG: hypothetical protein RL341_30 [Pseudomonadota bacterium]|jgi:hypothetical protein